MTIDEDTRRKLLTSICAARKAYFRLKKEIADLQQMLPEGTNLGTYKSKCIAGGGYIYHALYNKDAVLPFATDEAQFTKKRHLGRDHNPHYAEAILLLEHDRIREIKLDTFNRISNHLIALKKLYKAIKGATLDKTTKMHLSEFTEYTSRKSVYDAVKRQHFMSQLSKST